MCLALGAGVAAAQEDLTEQPVTAGLRSLVLETLEQNPGVRAALSAVEAARAQVRAAERPLYNPELEVDAEQAETRSGTLGLSQTLDWADKRDARAAVAATGLDVAQAEHASVRQQLAGELLTALGHYQTTVAVHGLAAQRLKLMQRFLDLAEQRHQAGDVNRVELDLARLAQTQARLDFAQAAADLAADGQSLAAVTGTVRGQWPALPESLPALSGFDVDALLQELPTLKGLRARMQGARATVVLRKRERQPDPSVGVRAGLEQAYRGANDENFGVAGLSLNIPLYVRNDYRAEVESAQAELDQAEQALQDGMRRARARLLSAAERYRLSREAWLAWQDSGQASLGSQATLLERLWRAGEMSTADYLMQLNQTLDTRISALEVRGRLWTAWADWLVASGRVDAWLKTNPAR